MGVQKAAVGTFRPVRTGLTVPLVLHTAGREQGLARSLWQERPGESRGHPLDLWRWANEDQKPTMLQVENKSEGESFPKQNHGV